MSLLLCPIGTVHSDLCQLLISDVTHDFPEEELRPDGRNNPGYFPAWLGMEILDEGQYDIVRKLGWGGLFTVLYECMRVATY